MMAVGMVTLASAQGRQNNGSFKDDKKDSRQVSAKPVQQPSFDNHKTILSGRKEGQTVTEKFSAFSL